MRRNAPVIIQKTEDEKSKAEIQKQVKAAEFKLGATRGFLSKTEEQVKTGAKTLKILNTSIEKTKVLVEKAEKKLSDLKKEHATELAKIGATKSAVAEAQSKVDAQLIKIEADFTKKKQELEEVLTALQVKITQAETDLKAFEGKITEYTEKLSILTTQITELENKCEDAGDIYATRLSATKVLDAKSVEFETKIEESEKRIKELETRESELTTSVEEKEATLGAVDPERAQLDEERVAFEKEKEEFMITVARVQKQEQMNKEDEKRIRAKYQKLGIPFN